MKDLDNRNKKFNNFVKPLSIFIILTYKMRRIYFILKTFENKVKNAVNKTYFFLMRLSIKTEPQFHIKPKISENNFYLR